MKIPLVILLLITSALAAARADFLDLPIQTSFILSPVPRSKGYIDLYFLPSGAIFGSITYRSQERRKILLKGRIVGPIERTFYWTSFDIQLRGAGETIRAHFSRTFVPDGSSLIVSDVLSGHASDRSLLLRKGKRFLFSGIAFTIYDGVPQGDGRAAVAGPWTFR